MTWPRCAKRLSDGGEPLQAKHKRRKHNLQPAAELKASDTQHGHAVADLKLAPCSSGTSHGSVVCLSEMQEK